jgi:acetoacetyl-CoA synthetase
MMWNLLVSGLCVGATIVLYDGDPGGSTIWDLARETGPSHVGVGAPFLVSCRKEGILPGDQPSIRVLGSTGAPLPAEGFRWVAEQLPGVWLQSISGGTDVCTAFVGASPLVPVWEGEISCRHLGCAVAAFDEDGRSVVGEQGELVLTEPMPSMPVAFLHDPDGSRYRAAYFQRFPGVWCHGDWITITPRGTCEITGRSDATLNRGGVRLGTSEFYSVVESLPEVADSVVVDVDGRLLLFVVVAPGADLDVSAIAAALRRELSPRHVPDEVHLVAAIPRTHSGKKLEVPIKRILTGTPAAEVVSVGALADPTAIEAFEAIGRARRGASGS